MLQNWGSLMDLPDHTQMQKLLINGCTSIATADFRFTFGIIVEQKTYQLAKKGGDGAKTIWKRQRLYSILNAANHDRHQFYDPDELNVGRSNNHRYKTHDGDRARKQSALMARLNCVAHAYPRCQFASNQPKSTAAPRLPLASSRCVVLFRARHRACAGRYG